MHLLLLTAQNKHKECKTIPHTDKINTFPCSLLSKLDTQISRKLSLTSLHTYVSSNYKIWFSHLLQPMLRKVTNIFKDTSTKISFRTNNAIRNKLNTRTRFTKIYTPSGIYQLQCQNLWPLLYRSNVLSFGTTIQRAYSRPMNPSINIPPKILHNKHEYGPMNVAMPLLHPDH